MQGGQRRELKAKSCEYEIYKQDRNRKVNQRD